MDLGAPNGPRTLASVRGISASGDVIFGLAYDALDVIRPFRWTAETGTVDLGAPADTPADAYVLPEHMSADGRVIVGYVRSADPSSAYHPFRWTEATGMQELLPREQSGYVTHLSQDGNVVLGAYMDTSRGFRWTEATGF